MQDTEVLVAHMLLEGYLQKFTTKNAHTVQVYVKPALSQSFDNDDNDSQKKKLVIQLQLLSRNDHHNLTSRKRKKRSRPPPRKMNNDDYDDDFGDCSGEGEEVAGPSPAKRRRRSNQWRVHVRAPSRNAAIAAEDTDPEWKPRRSGKRRKVVAQKQGKARRSTTLLDNDVIEISADDEVIEISSE
jgi:hypothetical protein